MASLFSHFTSLNPQSDFMSFDVSTQSHICPYSSMSLLSSIRPSNATTSRPLSSERNCVHLRGGASALESQPERIGPNNAPKPSINVDEEMSKASALRYDVEPESTGHKHYNSELSSTKAPSTKLPATYQLIKAASGTEVDNKSKPPSTKAYGETDSSNRKVDNEIKFSTLSLRKHRHSYSHECGASLYAKAKKPIAQRSSSALKILQPGQNPLLSVYGTETDQRRRDDLPSIQKVTGAPVPGQKRLFLGRQTNNVLSTKHRTPSDGPDEMHEQAKELGLTRVNELKFSLKDRKRFQDLQQSIVRILAKEPHTGDVFEALENVCGGLGSSHMILMKGEEVMFDKVDHIDDEIWWVYTLRTGHIRRGKAHKRTLKRAIRGIYLDFFNEIKLRNDETLIRTKREPTKNRVLRTGYECITSMYRSITSKHSKMTVDLAVEGLLILKTRKIAMNPLKARRPGFAVKQILECYNPERFDVEKACAEGDPNMYKKIGRMLAEVIHYVVKSGRDPDIHGKKLKKCEFNDLCQLKAIYLILEAARTINDPPATEKEHRKPGVIPSGSPSSDSCGSSDSGGSSDSSSWSGSSDTTIKATKKTSADDGLGSHSSQLEDQNQGDSSEKNSEVKRCPKPVVPPKPKHLDSFARANLPHENGFKLPSTSTSTSTPRLRKDSGAPSYSRNDHCQRYDPTSLGGYFPKPAWSGSSILSWLASNSDPHRSDSSQPFVAKSENHPPMPSTHSVHELIIGSSESPVPAPWPGVISGHLRKKNNGKTSATSSTNRNPFSNSPLPAVPSTSTSRMEVISEHPHEEPANISGTFRNEDTGAAPSGSSPASSSGNRHTQLPRAQIRRIPGLGTDVGTRPRAPSNSSVEWIEDISNPQPARFSTIRFFPSQRTSAITSSEHESVGPTQPPLRDGADNVVVGRMNRSSSSRGSSSIPESDVDSAGPARRPNRHVRRVSFSLSVPQPNNDSDEEEDQVDVRRLDAALFLETPRLGDTRLATTLLDQYLSDENCTVSMATIHYDHPNIVNNSFSLSTRDVGKKACGEQPAADYEARTCRDTKGDERSEGQRTGRTGGSGGGNDGKGNPEGEGSHESQSGSTGGKDSRDDGDSDDEKNRKGKETSKDDEEDNSSDDDDSEDQKTPEDSDDGSNPRSKQPVEQEPLSHPVAEPRQTMAPSPPPPSISASQRAVIHYSEPREHGYGYGRGEFSVDGSTYSFVSPDGHNVHFRLMNGGNAQQSVSASGLENGPTPRVPPDGRDSHNVGSRSAIDGNAQQFVAASLSEDRPTTRADFDFMLREYLDRGKEVNDVVQRMLTALGALDETMRPWRRVQEDMTEFLRNMGDLDTGARGQTRNHEEGVARNVYTGSRHVSNQEGGTSGNVGAGGLGMDRDTQEAGMQTGTRLEPAHFPDQGPSEEGEVDRETEQPPQPAPYPDQGPLGEGDEPHEHFFGFRY